VPGDSILYYKSWADVHFIDSDMMLPDSVWNNNHWTKGNVTSPTNDYRIRRCGQSECSASPHSGGIVVPDGGNVVRFFKFKAPALVVQAPIISVVATDKRVCWDLTVSNVADVAVSQNTFLYVDTLHPGGISNVSIINKVTGVPLTKVNGIFQIGAMNPGTTQVFTLCADYYSCKKDSIRVYAGWECSGYPANWPSYICQNKAVSLLLNEVPTVAELQMQILQQPAGPQQFCDTFTYEAEIRSVKQGSVFFNFFQAQLGPGMTVVPGSSELMWPVPSVGSGTYVPIANPTGGTTKNWNLYGGSVPTILALQARGLVGGGTGETDSSRYRIKFRVYTTCDPAFTSGKKRFLSARGKTFCENYSKNTNFARKPTAKLDIAGVFPAYDAVSNFISGSDIIACGGSNTLRTRVLNIGPGISGAQDSIEIALPSGISYIAGSTVGITNMGNVEPTVSIVS
jgi:hypothetical protein